MALAQLAEKRCEVDGVHEALASQLGDFQIVTIDQFIKGRPTDRQQFEGFVDGVGRLDEAEGARIQELLDLLIFVDAAQGDRGSGSSFTPRARSSLIRFAIPRMIPWK